MSDEPDNVQQFLGLVPNDNGQRDQLALMLPLLPADLYQRLNDMAPAILGAIRAEDPLAFANALAAVDPSFAMLAPQIWEQGRALGVGA